MPVFRAVAEEEGGRGDGHADDAIVDDFARGLAAATEKAIGRAPDAHTLGGRGFDDFGAIVAVERERLFTKGMFARFDDLQRDPGVSSGNGQVDNDIDVIPRQQVVNAKGAKSIFGGKRLRPIDYDVGASCHRNDIKGRAALDVSRRDIAGSD